MKIYAVIGLILAAVSLWTCQASDSNGSKQLPEEELMKTGAEITQTIGAELMKTVQQQMSEGGVAQALGFCQTHALPITDSLATRFNVSVKRTALRTRNPKNAPSDFEVDVLTTMQGQEKFDPAMSYSENGNAVYYEPIVLKEFCQTCHGIPGASMAVAVDSLIKSHYPDDRATGFSSGDLRGMWLVTFHEDTRINK